MKESFEKKKKKRRYIDLALNLSRHMGLERAAR